MQEIMEEVDLDQFVSQPVPEDPEKLRLSLIFSKDLITTLQQDIADLHHRLHIADSEYDGTNDIDVEDDIAAGVHVTNATLTRMDGDFNDSHEIDNAMDDNLYDDTNAYAQNKKQSVNLYEMEEQEDEDGDDMDYKADEALNKKQSQHEKFFSTYNILSKQVNTQEQLIKSMGSYQALLHLSDNAITFNNIVSGLQIQLKTAKDSFNMVRDTLDVYDDDDDDIDSDAEGDEDDDDEDLQDLEKNLFITNAKEILKESTKIVQTIDYSIDELNGAKHLIHPDQKKIFSLQSRIKELEVALPLHKIKKLAILNELPAFIKHELSDAKIQKQADEARELQRLRELRGHKKKATKTLVDDDIGGFEEKKGKEIEKEEDLNVSRIDSFNSSMDGVSTCLETLQSRLYNIGDTIEGMEQDLDTMDDPAATLLIGSIHDIKNQMHSCQDASHDIATYFMQSKQYVHPTQNVLITAINQYMEQKLQNDTLQKQIDILNGELNAKQEQINSLKHEKNINIYNEEDNQNLNIDDEEMTQEFVSQIAEQLRELQDKSLSIHTLLKQEKQTQSETSTDQERDRELKNKTSLSYDEIKRMDVELSNLRDIFSELSISLLDEEKSVLNLTPQNEYILRLETRYCNLKKLYRLKFGELECAKDAVIYNESLIESHNEEIEELETRLVRIMTSASTSAETRMEAINTMGQKSQTYRSVMDLIDDNLRLSSSALYEIEKLSKQYRSDNDINASQSKDIINYCKTIKKGLEAVQTEMSGTRNFVHPDREMVQALQQQILDEKNRRQQEQSQQEVHLSSPTAAVSFDRRSKSVHEIAWRKFNAGHEANMEDLEKKEREVLEEEIRNEILAEIQAQYDDRYDSAVARMRAKLQQDIREQIRLEYEDLEYAHISALQQQEEEDSHIDIEQIKMDLEEEYDKRLELERKKIDEFYANKQRSFESEIHEKNEKNNNLQKECASMQNDIEKLHSVLQEKENESKARIEEVSQSKLKLIQATSSEIDALRDKLKLYSDEIGKLVNKRKNGFD